MAQLLDAGERSAISDGGDKDQIIDEKIGDRVKAVKGHGV